MAPRYLVNFDSRELLQYEVEYLVIGSGIAGLYTAYTIAKAGGDVLVITKRMVEDTSTERAQGGIAAAISASDSPLLHEQDTLGAGAGLCDEEAVHVLVTEGPERVRELVSLGARFDRANGDFALTREGAHSQRRILHASGDATGAELQRVLSFQAHDIGVPILEWHFAVDLLVKDGRCYGALVLQEDRNRLVVFWARAVILATGGAGQLYRRTTNPQVVTGDGMALGYRAGAELSDLEFVQFHPTVLALPGAPSFLISEAVRGEGGLLRNTAGERFMPGYHPLAELAPRDVVTRAILKEMEKTGADHVYLDVSHLPPGQVEHRFPTISRTCKTYGVDVACDLIPVAPAAHYMMGGVKTGLDGQTCINGLYACGEVASAGIHGANRLASNSLLDGLVFGGRIARAVMSRKNETTLARPSFACRDLRDDETDYQALKSELQQIMQEYVGPLRSAEGLAKALAFFDRWQFLRHCRTAGPEALEVRNMLEVGHLIAEAAMCRTESRGAHFRTDFPERRERWEKHLSFRRQ
ncbi:L-aspartate oxidase [Desulforudis sp. 1088]|uniref:L-aspartate oxidase n=2 Tax=Candidatus Desulforudis TaxID=471826 RepID=UPI003CE5AF8C